MDTSLYLIVGLGKTGHSIARFLVRRNKPFVVFDTRTSPSGLTEFTAEFPGVDVFSAHFPPELYQRITCIISSPGVALDHPVMQNALDMGIPVIGDIECLARETSAPIIAITGTNGKSTVTTLVGEMARTAGLTAAVAGNIGTPVLDLLDDHVSYDLWVLELSSFQLDLTYSLAPIAATILNISPDHLDRHHSLDAYIQAKQRIYHEAKFMLYNRDDGLTIPMDQFLPAPTGSFGLDVPVATAFSPENWGLLTVNDTCWLACGQEKLMPIDHLKIKGRHNWANALAACALAQTAGIDFAHMRDVLQRFSGLPHRSQWVRTLDRVEWINDSKGTNIGATISAISGIGGSMQGKIVLIAGGQGKGADFTELRQSVGDYVRTMVLIGEDAELIRQALEKSTHILHADSLDEAVKMARAEAKPGDVVLLSPACASLDMFRDFNHRGEVYTEVVKNL
jgi:UDP-N-acetylmuramoylalanine--D-glutamate ligase